MAMTVLSLQMKEKALRIHSVTQVREELLKGGSFRSLGDIIRKFSGSEDPKKQLVEGLLLQNPEARRDSLERKVRNWLSGRTGTISREDAFCLCRILKLDVPKADDFMKAVTGEGFHWRSPSEIMWAYGIHNGYDSGRLRPLLQIARDMENQIRRQDRLNTVSRTETVSGKVLPLLDLQEASFLAGLQECMPELGNCHNTAYALFEKYMGLLENAGQEKTVDPKKSRKKKSEDEDDQAFEVQKMSTERILEEYFYRRLVPVSRRGEGSARDAFSDIQRSIRASWPDEASLSKMRTREINVTRKALILLFLATDGSETEFAEEVDPFEDPRITRDEMFENIYTRLDRMLQACGFRLLDPRTPFDWLILCCISVEDIWCIDQRLGSILKSIFPGQNAEN